jgi:Uma2 family endonuclease
MASVPVELAPGVPLQPLTLDQYERMVEHGVLREDDRVELLDGLLVAVSPPGALHAAIVTRLTDWAYDAIDRSRFTIRVQQPLRCLPASEPEPDLALVEAGDHTAQHPSEAALVVEVSVSSAPLDIGVKRSVYARSGVGEYWVLLLGAGVIRVHRDLRGGDYALVEEATTATFAGATLRVADLPPGL